METTRAIIERTGGPEAISWITEDLGAPAPGEVTIEHGAIGLNFIDIYHREGVYPLDLPSGLGMEAAGRVVAVGSQVSGISEGDRVATMLPPLGAYATARNISADLVMPVPDGIDDRLAAAAILKGCTAEFLVERCARVTAGSTVLVHAAAGGVGQLLVQWLKHLDVRVIATASAAKTGLAEQAGADAVIDYSNEDVAERVADLTAGAGVATVFDGVGQATWKASLGSLSRFGLLVSFGNASGSVTGVDLSELAGAGSLFVTRPTLMHYCAAKADRDASAARVWEMFANGALDVRIGQTYALQDAAKAQRDLAARKTTGSTVLVP